MTVARLNLLCVTRIVDETFRHGQNSSTKLLGMARIVVHETSRHGHDSS